MPAGKIPDSLLKPRGKGRKKPKRTVPAKASTASTAHSNPGPATTAFRPSGFSQSQDDGGHWPPTPPNESSAYGTARVPPHPNMPPAPSTHPAPSPAPQPARQATPPRPASPATPGEMYQHDTSGIRHTQHTGCNTTFGGEGFTRVGGTNCNNAARDNEDVEEEEEEETEGGEEEEDDEATAGLGNYGRTFARMGGVFTPIGDIVEKGANWETDCSNWITRNHPRSEEGGLDPLNDPDPRLLSNHCDSKRRTIEGWNILCNIITGFREGVKEMLHKGLPVKELGICQKLQSISKTCRGNDTTGLKTKALYYIDPNLDAIQPEIHWSNLGKKAVRGWNHTKIAAMLLPLKHDLTEANINAAGAKQLPSHHDLFPRYLYPIGQAYVVNNEDVGLMQGHYIIFVCRHIFTGPKSVLLGPLSLTRSRKGTIAQRMGISRLTPRAVAYACVQAHFAISNQETWDEMFWDFDLDVSRRASRLH